MVSINLSILVLRQINHNCENIRKLVKIAKPTQFMSHSVKLVIIRRSKVETYRYRWDSFNFKFFGWFFVFNWFTFLSNFSKLRWFWIFWRIIMSFSFLRFQLNLFFSWLIIYGEYTLIDFNFSVTRGHSIRSTGWIRWRAILRGAIISCLVSWADFW